MGENNFLIKKKTKKFVHKSDLNNNKDNNTDLNQIYTKCGYSIG